MMTKEKLSTLIEARYKDRRAFIEDLNAKVPSGNPLDETTLSRYIKGKVGLSGNAELMFILFFLHFHSA